MKILYAIQGTGNGHISRARDIIPLLQKKGSLDVLISGTEADVDPGFAVTYKLKGLSFVFGKKGGIDVAATYKKARLKRFYNEIKNLPIQDYDVVINDFEPVSAWACRFNHKPCIGLSHQAAVLNKQSPQSKERDIIGKSILKNYAPVTDKYGFHFKACDKKIFTPVIRSEIRNALNCKLPHYTVYLPAYNDDRIIKILKEIKDTQWEVFSKHTDKSYTEKNISIRPVSNTAFINSLITCTGVLCGAGFETPAEALFLQKKLMVIPMKGQYEQQCNAAALKEMNVPVLKKLKKENIEKIKSWVKSDTVIKVSYPDITSNIIDNIFKKYSINPGDDTAQTDTCTEAPKDISYNRKKIRKIAVSGLLHQIIG